MDDVRYLIVSFKDKEKVKSLGARWSSDKKRWFITKDLDPEPFKNWLPTFNESELQLAIAPFYLLQSSQDCWRCKRNTEVIAFGSHGTVESGEYNKGLTKYVYVSFIPDRLKAYLELHHESFYMDFSSTSDSFYYMNHCQHCNALLGDFFMHCESGGTFFPVDAKMSANISIIELKDSGYVKIIADQSYGVMELILENGLHLQPATKTSN